MGRVPGPYHCGWVQIAADENDPASWTRVTVETTEEAARQATETAIQQMGGLRALYGGLDANPAAPTIDICNQAEGAKSLVQRMRERGELPAAAS